MAEGYIPDYNLGIFGDYGKINEIFDRYSGRIEKDGDFADMMKKKDLDNIFRNKLGSFAFWPDSYSEIEGRIYDMLK